MTILKPHLLLLLSFIFVGCGPGISDYSEKIKGSELVYIDNNTLNRVIVQNNQKGEQQTLIGSTILSYQVNGDYLIGVRQIVNNYLCEETRNDVEVTDNLEFFSIYLSSKQPLYTTLRFEKYTEFKNYLSNIKLSTDVAKQFHPDKLSNKYIRTSSLGDCTNPKLISN
jgi:hypothetical protein